MSCLDPVQVNDAQSAIAIAVTLACTVAVVLYVVFRLFRTGVQSSVGCAFGCNSSYGNLGIFFVCAF